MASRLPTIFAWGVVGLTLAYLAADLTVFKGPLSRSIGHKVTADSHDVVARVDPTSIHRSQLERALLVQLWSEGKSLTTLSSAELTAASSAALDGLIDGELLRQQLEAAPEPPSVSEDEIDARIRRLASRFESKTTLETAMQSQGIPHEAALRQWIKSQLLQQKWLEIQIDPETEVSEQQALDWYTAHRVELSLPQRIQLRHVFLPTLDHPSAEAEATLAAALIELSAGRKNFATLASELSEDPATKDRGGELGWMSRERLPADFAATAFALADHQPTLIRSKLGWHLAEITARKPPELPSFEQARAEIIAALSAIKRHVAINRFRQNLRANAAARIQVCAP
jgi:parvulin-like peptidyl-prolyl isomerase